MILLKYDATRGINCGLLTAVFKRKDGVVLFMDKIAGHLDLSKLDPADVIKQHMVVAVPVGWGDALVTLTRNELVAGLHVEGIVDDAAGFLYALTRTTYVQANANVEGDFLSRGVLIVHNPSAPDPVVRYNMITGGVFDTLTAVVDVGVDLHGNVTLCLEMQIEGISEFADLSKGFDLESMIDKGKLAAVIATTTDVITEEQLAEVLNDIELPFFDEEELLQMVTRK